MADLEPVAFGAASSAEFFGGIALLLDCWRDLQHLCWRMTMLVAVITVHLPNGCFE